MADSDRATFCRLVTARSNEHREAIRVAVSRGWTAIAVGILRQELDSMVRVIFLLATPSRKVRSGLIKESLIGKPWAVSTPAGKMKKVTDRDMVMLAGKLHGWTESVYRFGCAFIHLSNCHDYLARDPVRALSVEDRQALVGHLRSYHGGPRSDDPSLSDVMPLLPLVFEKIASNLQCYVDDLERNADLRP